MCALVCLHAPSKQQARCFKEHVCTAKAIGLRQVQVACLSLQAECKCEGCCCSSFSYTRMSIAEDLGMQVMYLNAADHQKHTRTSGILIAMLCKHHIRTASKKFLFVCSDLSLPAGSNLSHDHHMHMAASATVIS